jgi:hypothetical protein
MAQLQQSTVNGFRLGRDGGGNLSSTAFGRYAANGGSNNKTAIGYLTGCAASNVKNTFVGSLAGRQNTGFYNAAAGFCAMYGSGGRCRSVAIGQRAHRSATGGRDNVMLGSFAGDGSTTNVQTVLIGVNAGRNNNLDNGLGIGVDSLCASGFGTENTAIGFRAQRYGSGIRNISIGSYANTNINLNFTIAIGRNTCVGSSYHMIWGGSYNNKYNCVWGGWSYFSDARDKTDVETLDSNLGLNFIRRLRPVKYSWDNRQSYVEKCGYEYGTKDGTLADTKEHYGVIAQELKQVLDDIGEEFGGLLYNEQEDSYRVRYAEFIAPLTKAVQELDTRTQALKLKVGII